MIIALTSLRGIAALFVLVPHALRVDTGAYTAVECFFVLSGFVLARKYAGRLGTSSQVVQFFWARFARMWPAAVFAAAVLLTFHQLAGFSLPVLPAIISTVTMTQAFWPLGDLVDTVSWSASIECCLYLAFPLLLPAIVKYPRLAFAGSCAAAVLLYPWFVSPSHGLDAVGRALPEFVAGAAASLAFRHRLWSRDLVVCAALLSLLLTASSGLMCLSLAVLVTGLAHNQGRVGTLLARRHFQVLGDASYSIYIFQYAANAPTVTLIAAFGITSRWQLAIAFIVAAVGWGFLVHRTIETPARAFLLRLSPRVARLATSRRNVASSPTIPGLAVPPG